MAVELEAVLAELDAVRTALERDLAFVEIEESFGRIFAAAVGFSRTEVARPPPPPTVVCGR